MNKYETIQRNDSLHNKKEVIMFVNRLTYVHYDLALYYNNYKPKNYAIFKEFEELNQLADKVSDIPLFDVYLALITIYYEFAIMKDRSIKKNVLTTFHNQCTTGKVKMSFLVDNYSGPNPNELYLAKPIQISSIKQNYPKIVKRLEEIAKQNVRVTSYMSSLRIGGFSRKQTRKNRKN